MAQAEQTTVKFQQKAGPEVRLTGTLIGHVDARRDGAKANPERQRWTELHLYQLAGGDWVAVTLGLSDKEGEADLGAYRRIAARHSGRDELLGKGKAEGLRQEGAMAREVMDFFEWSPLAWALADQMGWKLVEVIE